MAEKKRIVLVSPTAGIFDDMLMTVPLAPLAISRKIDRDRYDPVIVDQRRRGWRQKLDDALAGDVLLVGISSLTGAQLHFGADIARHVKRRRPKVPIVWGGIHPTCAPDQMLREEICDAVVVGEGEDALPVLADALAENEMPKDVAGVAYKTDDGTVRMNPAGPFHDIDGLENPPYDLIDIDAYLKDIQQREFFIEAARGCRFNCTFCYNPAYSRGMWRPRSVSRIMDNIRYLHDRYGISNFFLIDDSFFLSEERVTEFLERIEGDGLRIKWSCEGNMSNLSRMSDQLLGRLVSAGLTWLSIGVESGSERIRKYFRKNVDVDSVMAFNRRASNYDFSPRYNFVTGTPIEQKADMRKTVSLVQTLLKENPHALVRAVYITVPFPGTEYLSKCAEYGLEPSRDLESWADFDPFTVSRHLPWMKARKKRMFEFLMFSSFFVDRKAEYHLSESTLNRLIAFLGHAYRSVARFRLRHFLYFPFPEAALIKSWIRWKKLRYSPRH